MCCEGSPFPKPEIWLGKVGNDAAPVTLHRDRLRIPLAKRAQATPCQPLPCRRKWSSVVTFGLGDRGVSIRNDPTGTAMIRGTRGSGLAALDRTSLAASLPLRISRSYANSGRISKGGNGNERLGKEVESPAQPPGLRYRFGNEAVTTRAIATMKPDRIYRLCLCFGQRPSRCLRADRQAREVEPRVLGGFRTGSPREPLAGAVLSVRRAVLYRHSGNLHPGLPYALSFPLASSPSLPPKVMPGG